MKTHPLWRFVEWVSVLIYAALVYEMARLWLSPTSADLARLQALAVLMGFEFIFVHSGLFMAVMPRRISLFFLVPFYGIVAVVFNTATPNNMILFLYLGLMFSRLRYAFSNPDATHRARTVKVSIFAALIYLSSVAVIAIGETSLPHKGLSKEFLSSEGYYETLNVGGIFTEQPHLPLIMGIIYFSMMIVLEVILLTRRKPEQSENLGI